MWILRVEPGPAFEPFSRLPQLNDLTGLHIPPGFRVALGTGVDVRVGTGGVVGILVGVLEATGVVVGKRVEVWLGVLVGV